MSKKALINGVVCFVLGLGVGLSAPKIMRQFRPPHPMEGEKFIDHFSSKLDLSDEQTKAIRPIFKEARESMRALREEVGPRFHQIREETKARLGEVLDPKQQRKLERMHARMDERRKKMRERFGGGPPGFMRDGQKGGERKGPPPRRTRE